MNNQTLVGDAAALFWLADNVSHKRGFGDSTRFRWVAYEVQRLLGGVDVVQLVEAVSHNHYLYAVDPATSIESLVMNSVGDMRTALVRLAFNAQTDFFAQDRPGRSECCTGHFTQKVEQAWGDLSRFSEALRSLRARVDETEHGVCLVAPSDLSVVELVRLGAFAESMANDYTVDNGFPFQGSIAVVGDEIRIQLIYTS